MTIIIDNKEVQVDESDWLIHSQHEWVIGHTGYLIRMDWRNGERKQIRYHREVCPGLKPNQEVDHINRNRLDNRKENLRICTRTQNKFNTDKGWGKSIYKGVSFRADNGQWCAIISVRKKNIRLFMSPNQHECGYAYNIAVKAVAREFAWYNTIVEEPTEERKAAILKRVTSRLQSNSCGRVVYVNK